MTIQYAYTVGELIEARDCITGQWRLGWIVSLAPQRGRPGYYVNWLKPPYSEVERAANDLPMPSSGGWQYELVMRKPVPETLAFKCNKRLAAEIRKRLNLNE